MTLVAKSVTKKTTYPIFFIKIIIMLIWFPSRNPLKIIPKSKVSNSRKCVPATLKDKKSKTPEIYHKNFMPNGMWELVQFGILSDLGKKKFTHP